MGFSTELKTFSENFFDETVFPFRAALKQLRVCDRELLDLNERGLDTKNKKTEIQKIKGKLENQKPSKLLALFLLILDEPNAAVICSELASQLKLFVERNTKAEMIKREDLRKRIKGASDNSNELQQQLIEVNDKIELKTLSIEIVFREINSMSEYTDKKSFTIQASGESAGN